MSNDAPQPVHEAPQSVAVKIPAGLSAKEARRRLAEYGPNEVAEKKTHPVAGFLSKFWAPVPWMLEVTVVLELVLGKRDEAIIIGVLLVFNAALGFFQERNAAQALSILRQRLSIQARVLRDGSWQALPARELVPGDVVYVRVGDLVAADLRLVGGEVLLDQSALTGESNPVEALAGATAYAGTTVKRGEATGEVTATGPRTYFGKTAELVRTSRTPGHLQEIIFAIIKYLVALDVALIALLLVYTFFTGIPLAEILPFSLMLLVASVPVALPATFTLASALGTRELAGRGVLVSRLSAIEEAAAMDVLASDKTGTITRNELSLAAVRARAPYSDEDVLRLAALACDEATQDPIDLAVLKSARERGVVSRKEERLKFIPFDPATKRSEALVLEGSETRRVVKGAPLVVAQLVAGDGDFASEVDALAGQGYRVLAVAEGPQDGLRLAGLLAFLDPPREDSAALIGHLHDLGVRVVMVSGDGLATAKTVAAQVGITGPACAPDHLRAGPEAAAADCDVFGGVLPEDKHLLVRALQRAGHIVGMTGDGVNDAPALKQAEVGVAVANATDVAKAAASVVLTNPGLVDIVAAVETSRRIYQRMLTYTLNKIIKTIEIAVFLSLGVVLTRTLIVTPLLIVLLLFTNDFVTMSIATDRVSFSQKPDRWQIRTLVLTALPLALLTVLLSFAVLFAGRNLLHLALPQLQTLVFLLLVFSGQGTVYLVRERHHLWHSRPSRWLLLSSSADIAVVTLLAARGILMAPLSLQVVAGLLAVVGLYLVAVDFFKIRIFQHFALH
jgi:H+-transporting ATPase